MSKSNSSGTTSSRRSRTTNTDTSGDGHGQQRRPEDVPVIDSWFGTVRSDWPFLVGVGISVLSLTASGLITLSRRYNSSSEETKGKDKSSKQDMLDISGMDEELDMGNNDHNTPGGTHRKKTKDGLERYPDSYVANIFKNVLDAQRTAAGKQYADQFYERILTWKPSQFNPSGRIVVCNFLFWYYRNAKPTEIGLHHDEAEHIHYWADYDISSEEKCEFEERQQKYDIEYSLAAMRRSIPHIKQFYEWICSEDISLPELALLTEIQSSCCTETTGTLDHSNSIQSTPGAMQNTHSCENHNHNHSHGHGHNHNHNHSSGGDYANKKNYYALTRFQTACILGNWKDVKFMGSLVEMLSLKAGKMGKNNAFNNYTFRALENRIGSPDYGQFYKIADVLQEKIPGAMLGPPKFGEWTIYSLRYKNVDPTISIEENSQFVIMQESMIDEEGYAVLLPISRERGTLLGISTVVHHWGRICQLPSPMGARSRMVLPMVGCASDSQIYAQYEWTYPLSQERQMVKKVGKLDLERLPTTKTVNVDMLNEYESPDSTPMTGNVWEGILTVVIEKWDEPELFLRRSFSVGNPAFSFQNNPFENTASSNTPTGTSNTNKTTKNTNTEKKIMTHSYYVEMVIDQNINKKNGDGDNDNDYENQNDGDNTTKTPKAD